MRAETRPTVAERAGVSASTASLAFAGGPGVAEPTRARVLDAARELGYPGPDPLAASLRRGRSGVVGTFVGERLLYAFRDPVAVQLLDGITEVLGPHGVGLLLLAGDAGRPEQAQLARIPLDAAIFATCGREDDPALQLLHGRGVPLVAVEGPVLDGVALVDIDQRAVSPSWPDTCGNWATAGWPPWRCRCDRTAVGGRWTTPGGPSHYRDVRHRIDGVADVFGAVPIVETANNSLDEGEVAGRSLLDVPPAGRPTAVIAQSDVLAAGVLRAAESLGLPVTVRIGDTTGPPPPG